MQRSPIYLVHPLSGATHRFADVRAIPRPTQLIKQLVDWYRANPDTIGIYPQVDLSIPRVVGTQDIYSSWDGRTSDVSDWTILYCGGEIGDIAVEDEDEDDAREAEAALRLFVDAEICVIAQINDERWVAYKSWGDLLTELMAQEGLTFEVEA